MIRPSFARATAFAALTLAALSLHAADTAASDNDEPVEPRGRIRETGTRSATPEISPASDEAEQALKRMKLPPGLEARLWAAEPMLANPVAIAFDERGRLFVAETYRYRSSVLDIRDYMWMLEDELACRTLDDRTALIQKAFGPAGVKELSIETEVVRLLEDSQHTGVADKSYVYVDGFNTPLDGIASGVLARRGKVWFTNIPSLWQLSGDVKAETRTELSRGYGIRFNYTGHDLHGLTFGPDGKIYFSCGDRGTHARAKDGSLVDVPDMGAVFRCNPDGTHLEVVASGLRNPQDLVFTENGDLFTGDNDCDQGDEERLVQIVEGGDSGWRIGYQFPPLEKGSPWLADHLWWQRHEGQAAYLLAPICNIEDGPSGITYYPGTGLNDSYRGNIFITHFKGSIAKSGIYTYKLKAKGSSYEIDDAKPFLTSALPTDVKFGPDGRLYYSDWAEGWPKSKRGRIYAIDDPQHANDPLVKATQELIASDFTQKSPDELARLLAHPDWRVRLEAQFTLAERGSASIETFARIARDVKADPLARRHALWGLGQLAETTRQPALDVLRGLVHDADAEVRAQAIKLLGDHHAADQFDVFIAALKDPSNRVKFFAAQSLGKTGGHGAIPAVFAALRENNDRDEYLRHALVMALVGNAQVSHPMTTPNGAPALGIAVGEEPKELTAAIHDESRAVRLGVLLALRRIATREGANSGTSAARIAEFLHDPDPYLVREAALAINDVPITPAVPALAALLDQPIADEPVMLRAINAHFRLGQSANATALAAYAGRPDAPARLRAEALAQLALWPKPPQRDRLVGVYRPLAEKTRDAAVAVAALTPKIPGLLAPTTPATVQTATFNALEELNIAGAADALYAAVADEQQSAATRAAALSALDKIKDPRLPEALKIAAESKAPALRLAALPIATRLSPEAATPVLTNLVNHGNIEEQKMAFRSLALLKQPAADALIAEQLRRLAEGQVAPAVQLELLNAAARRSDPNVKRLLAEREAQLAASKDPLAPFRVALAGGDAKRGERIFNTQPTLACIRCHRAGGDGGDAGPNLAEVGAKYPREYLLESIVKPNAKIAPGFDTIVLTLKSGGSAAGIVASETPDQITLRNTDNKLVTVKKTDVLKRDGAPSGMPEIFGTILSKSQLRDVVEYLASLKAKPTRIEDARPRALRGLPPPPKPAAEIDTTGE